MKNTKLIGLAIVVLIGVGLLPGTRDALKWHFASSGDKAQDYAKYLAAWPAGRHASEASARYDERSWADAQAGKTIEHYRQYGQTHPSGARLAEARTRIEDLTWQKSTNTETIQSLEAYLESYNMGRFAAPARTRIEDLTWQKSTNANTIQNLEAYLKTYEAGRFAAIARTRIEDLTWQKSTNTETIQSLEAYLESYNAGRFAAPARIRIEDLVWQQSTNANTIQSLAAYLKTYEAGRFAATARARIEDLTWQQSTNANTIQSLEAYLKSYNTGRFAATARTRIEDLTWQQSKNANTIKSLCAYAEAYPRGRFVAEAQSRQVALRTDDGPYTTALQKGTESALNDFLTEFPGHARESDTKQAIRDITEGRDIVDLLAEKKVEIQTQGSGIQSVSVRVRRLVPYPLTIRVPVGSYFVSARQSAQNMVTTAESKVRLTTDDWRSISVSAACANRPRTIPSTGDSFTVQRSPHQEELARLMPVLDRAGVAYATRQAAVWIVTDNASYSDLGVLVSRSQFQASGGTRTIRETETARAIKICTEAGIDITRKRIWSDKQTILRGLSDADLRKWLEDKSELNPRIRIPLRPDGEPK